MALGIVLRKADFSDIEFLFQLRNQAAVYCYFRNPKAVPWPEHINWLTPILLGLTEKSLRIIEINKERIGQIRFDQIDKKTAEISVSLLKKFQGQGIGFDALKKAIRIIRRERPALYLAAEVHKNNLASQKLFAKLGFAPQNKTGKWRQYVL